MSNLLESDASHKRAQRYAKKLEKQGKPGKADDALKIAFNKEVVRAKGKNPNPGPATTKLYDRIKTPKTKGQGSFLKMSQSVEESVFNVYRNLALCFLSESKASHERAQRVAKNLDPEEAAKVKDKAFNQEVERADRVRRKREAEARRKAEEEGIEYTPKPTATERMKKRIRTPKTNGQGSFLRMSQSVKESVFNTYRNLAYCLLENEVELKGPYWNTSKLSPEERADRAGEDTQRNFQNDVRGKKHVKRREKRLARRSELAREAEARAKDKNKK